MKPTKPQFAIVVVAWVAITLLCVAFCQAAMLPRALLEVQPNLCEVDADSSRGSGVYVGIGLVLTCEHLIRGRKSVTCKFFGGGTYPGVVVRQSREFDNAYIRIERPKEPAIRGLRLSPRNPRSGDTIWKAGYGHNPRKLFWHKGTMNHTYGGWIKFGVSSIGGDSGGPMFIVRNGECFLLGNLWGTDGRNTIGSKPSTIARTLGVYALDALDTEWHLTANCGPFGCSPRRTQIGGGLFSSGLRQRITPKAPEQRDPSGIEAVIPPLDVDTGLISAQVSTMRDQANAAIQQANAATQAAQDQLALERDNRQKAEVDDLRAELEVAQKPAFPDPVPSNDPREEVATSRMSISETAESYFPWIIICAMIVGGLVYFFKNYKKDGIAAMSDAIDAGQQAAASAEALIETVKEFIAATAPPSPAPPPSAQGGNWGGPMPERPGQPLSTPPMPTPQPLPIGGTSFDQLGRPNSSPVVLARASKAKLTELNTQRAEAAEMDAMVTKRALEDLKRDVDAVEALEAVE